MKPFRMFTRSIRDAFKSVFRNFSLSLASISCITITLIIVAISIMASFNVDNFAKVIQKDITIVVFLNNDFDVTKKEEFEAKLKKINNVDLNHITFKSNEQTKNEMQQESDFYREIMGEWTTEDNPLKNSYLVKVEDIEKIKETAKQINAMEEVSIVKYGEGMVEQLVSTFKIVEKVAYGIVIALIVVTVFLIINTIKLTIFSRKREISIMRLVGASNTTIKTPFVIEGMVLGFIGAIVPVIIVVFGYFAFYNQFEGQLFTPIIKLIAPEPFIYMVSGLVIIIGMIVGMIGSATAVRKYLKI